MNSFAKPYNEKSSRLRDDYAAFDDNKGNVIVRHRTVDEEAGMGEWQEVQ